MVLLTFYGFIYGKVDIAVDPAVFRRLHSTA